MCSLRSRRRRAYTLAIYTQVQYNIIMCLCAYDLLIGQRFRSRYPTCNPSARDIIKKILYDLSEPRRRFSRLASLHSTAALHRVP